MHGGWGGAGGQSGQREANLPQDGGRRRSGECLAPLFNQDFLEKLSISSFNINRLSSPKSSLMCPGCETDIGDLDQGCEHGRLGASQLKVACALCSPRYEQWVPFEDTQKYWFNNTKPCQPRYCVRPVSIGGGTTVTDVWSGKQAFPWVMFWQIWIVQNIRWTTWTSWVTLVQWALTPRAPRTPRDSPQHPSLLELAIRARAVASTGIFSWWLHLWQMFKCEQGYKPGYQNIHILMIWTWFLICFQCWEKQRLHGQYQKRLLSGGPELWPRCYHRRGHRRLGRKLPPSLIDLKY